MTQIEKVARAMCRYAGKNPDELDNNVADGLFYPNWTEFSGLAREAIAAMREPTPKMIHAEEGWETPENIWRHMADAALTPAAGSQAKPPPKD